MTDVVTFFGIELFTAKNVWSLCTFSSVELPFEGMQKYTLDGFSQKGEVFLRTSYRGSFSYGVAIQALAWLITKYPTYQFRVVEITLTKEIKVVGTKGGTNDKQASSGVVAQAVAS